LIVVVASSLSGAARSTIRRWGVDRAAVLTCDDLSTPGWRQYEARDGPNVAVIGGRTVPRGDISGVITCLPSVSELELLHIASADRAYVAAEMTAFLLAWLSTLRCPVVNRPSPVSLTGPFWRREQWVSAAEGVGLPVVPVRRRVSLRQDPEPGLPQGATVTAVGGRTVGDAHPEVRDRVRSLAETTGVDVLTVRLTDPGPHAAFISADPTPNLTSEETADQILEYVESVSYSSRVTGRSL
jgi:hypothetical protein